MNYFIVLFVTVSATSPFEDFVKHMFSSIPIRTIPLVDGGYLRIVPASTQTVPRLPLPMRFDPEFPTLNYFLRYRWLQQTRTEHQDRGRYAPDTRNMDRERTPMGEMKFGKPIYRGFDSVVVPVIDRRDIIVKYQIHHDSNSLHILLNDAWLSEAAWSLGIAPRIYFVSPGASLPRKLEGKLAFRSSCMDRGEVRYMIAERLGGKTLDEFADQFDSQIIPLRIAILIAIDLLTNLQKLHDSSIVHGDIHGGNVMVIPSGDTWKVKLIDFGRGFIDTSGTNISNDRLFRDTIPHPLASPWQLMGRAWGKRDDVFKALITIARLINDEAFEIYEEKMANSGFGTQRLLYWRTQQFMFKIPGTSTFDPFSPINLGVSRNVSETIRGGFVRMQRIAAGMADVNKRPPYEAIISELESCATLLAE